MRCCSFCGTPGANEAGNCPRCGSPVPVRMFVLFRSTAGQRGFEVVWPPFLTLGQGVQALLSLHFAPGLPADVLIEVGGRTFAQSTTVRELSATLPDREPYVLSLRRPDGSEFICELPAEPTAGRGATPEAPAPHPTPSSESLFKADDFAAKTEHRPGPALFGGLQGPTDRDEAEREAGAAAQVPPLAPPPPAPPPPPVMSDSGLFNVRDIAAGKPTRGGPTGAPAPAPVRPPPPSTMPMPPISMPKPAPPPGAPPIPPADVQALRQRTGLGMMEAKGYLSRAGGDMAQAEESIRKSGVKYSLRAPAAPPQPEAASSRSGSAEDTVGIPPAMLEAARAPAAAAAPAKARAVADTVVMEPLPATAPTRSEITSEKDLRRRASVRWYRKMNPERMYPLTVVLSKSRIREVQVAGVAHAVSEQMLSIPALSPFVKVRPILPGCGVFPPEHTVDVTEDLVKVRFQVVPQFVGEVTDARIELFWQDRLLSTIPLQTEVAQQTVAQVMAVAGVVWPFVASGVKATTGTDLTDKDYLQGLFAQVMALPGATEFGFALIVLVGAIFYWKNRPRESTEETDVLGVKQMSAAELVAAGRKALAERRFAEAVGLFEDAVNVAPNDAAAIAGLARAYRQAESTEKAGQVLAAAAGRGISDPELHFQSGCCLALLGRKAEAIAALRTAVRLRRSFMARIAGEQDLISLRGLAEYEVLVTEGR